MTPCQRLGYKVGEWYVFKGPPYQGTWMLVEDDGTDMPLFTSDPSVTDSNSSCTRYIDINKKAIPLENGEDMQVDKKYLADVVHKLPSSFVFAHTRQGEKYWTEVCFNLIAILQEAEGE